MLQKKVRKNICSILILPLIILLLVLVIVLVKNLRHRVSSDILYITPPITSFAGIIEKIESNSIIVKQIFNPSLSSGLPTKELSYKIVVKPETNIFKPFGSVPYLFKTVMSTPLRKTTFVDLHVGEEVNITTNADLRLLEKAEFEAATISYVFPAINSFNAKIIDISQSGETAVLTVDASPRASHTPNQPTTTIFPTIQYEILITSNTEISKLVIPITSKKKPEPKILSVSDLKKEMDIAVYTEGDISQERMVKALLIQPIDKTPPLPPNLF